MVENSAVALLPQSAPAVDEWASLPSAAAVVFLMTKTKGMLPPWSYVLGSRFVVVAACLMDLSCHPAGSPVNKSSWNCVARSGGGVIMGSVAG